jgi:hypothetical protein
MNIPAFRRCGPESSFFRTAWSRWQSEVSKPDFGEMWGNSPDISKGISQTGMCEFESSEVSQAVRVSENFLLSMKKARKTRAFLIAISLWRPMFELFCPRIPKSLQPNPRKLPFSGDSPWRPKNKSTAR